MSMQLFVPITKVDASRRLVYGTIAEEIPDKAGELFDYATSKPFFERWSSEIARASDGKSVGNLRAMHGLIAAGKLSRLSFDDAGKRIEAVGKVVDDAEWTKVVEGVYTGFSIGGNYVERWPDAREPALMRYTAEPIEVSLVDNPCLPSATFSVIKTDGTVEERSFKSPEDVPEDVGEGASAAASANPQPSARPAPVQPRQIWDCGVAGHAHLIKAEAARCMATRSHEVLPGETQGGKALDKAETSTVGAVPTDQAGDADQGDPGAAGAAGAGQIDTGLTQNVFGPDAVEEGAAGRGAGAQAGDGLWRLLGNLRATLDACDLDAATDGSGKKLAPELRTALEALASALDEGEDDDDSSSGNNAKRAEPGAHAARAGFARVQTVHDLAAALGAACQGTSKNVNVGALTEMLARRDRLHRGELAKRLDEREAAFLEMRGVHEAQLAAVKAEHGATRAALASLETRLAVLEALPAEPKGKLKLIEKGEDLGGNGAATPEIDPSDTLALIKQAQQNPKRYGLW